MKRTTRSWMTAGFALVVASGWANAQAPGRPPAQANDRPAGDLPGPIDNLNDLEQTGRMLFKIADTNNDGLISQKEAIDAGNLMVGGFFFRADQNGDGILSQDEAKQAREALFTQKPLLRYMVERGKTAVRNEKAGNEAGTDPAKALGSLLDTNNDKQIQATEVRQAVQTAVQGLYAFADTNHDNQLSPTEVNAAIIGAARTVAQAMFQQADADHNGSLSRAEFDKAIVEPANLAFAMLDADNDGQVSPQEAQQARQVLENQLKMLIVPEPANSVRNLIRTGVKPDQIAPVPNALPATAAPRR